MSFLNICFLQPDQNICLTAGTPFPCKNQLWLQKWNPGKILTNLLFWSFKIGPTVQKLWFKLKFIGGFTLLLIHQLNLNEKSEKFCEIGGQMTVFDKIHKKNG